MSAGHPHKRDNTRSKGELKRLLTEGGAPQFLKRFDTNKLDTEHDVHDLAGYSVDGTTPYLDRDFFRALVDPEHAKAIGIPPIDTGLSVEDTIRSLLRHEGVEKAIIDSDNPIDLYLPAHDLATIAEHDMVRQKGGTPVKYERGLKAAIAYCEKKPLKNPPPDLACAPMLDDPNDENDKKALKQLKAAGVEDAFKVSKEKVDYSKSSGPDRCDGCKSWQQDRAQELSTCAVVDGLVRNSRWCKKYQAISVRKLDHNAHAKWRSQRLHGQVQHAAPAG